MTHAELLAIWEDPAHLGHLDLVQRFARFFGAGGILAICLGVHIDQEPGDIRRAKVAQVLKGRAAGEPGDVSTVLAYIQQAGYPVTNLFHMYEEELAESAAEAAASGKTQG